MSAGGPVKRRALLLENRIVRFGAIASAIAAVVGLAVTVRALITGSDTPARADITTVEVGDRVGIREAFARTPVARDCADISDVRRFRVRAPERGGMLAARRTRVHGAQLPGGGLLAQDATPTPTPTATATPSATVTPTATPTPDPPLELLGTPAVTTIDGEEYEVVPRQETVQAGGHPLVMQMEGEADDLPEGVEANTVEVAVETVPPDEQQRIAEQVLLVRTGGAAEPAGRLIDVAVALEGLEDECLHLRWSLYDGRTETRVPERWLRDRPGARFVATTDSATSTGQFWVPLPRRGGRFFVRMALFTESGARLAIGRSATFAQPAGDARGFAG